MHTFYTKWQVDFIKTVCGLFRVYSDLINFSFSILFASYERISKEDDYITELMLISSNNQKAMPAPYVPHKTIN